MSVTEMLGKTCTSVRGMENGSDEVTFEFSDGTIYKLYHEQDCCETVLLEDVCGDPGDLLGVLATSEEVSGSWPAPEWHESYTWTFYRFATERGTVTLRWLGESNGYYSESVDFLRVDTDGLTQAQLSLLRKCGSCWECTGDEIEDAKELEKRGLVRISLRSGCSVFVGVTYHGSRMSWHWSRLHN